MKRVVLLACALLALASPATAQTDEEIIERAVLAAPAGRGGTGQTEAMVVTWDEDGTRRVLLKAQTILSAGTGLIKTVSAHSACNARTKITWSATNKILNSFGPAAPQKRRKP